MALPGHYNNYKTYLLTYWRIQDLTKTEQEHSKLQLLKCKVNFVSVREQVCSLCVCWSNQFCHPVYMNIILWRRHDTNVIISYFWWQQLWQQWFLLMGSNSSTPTRMPSWVDGRAEVSFPGLIVSTAEKLNGCICSNNTKHINILEIRWFTLETWNNLNCGRIFIFLQENKNLASNNRLNEKTDKTEKILNFLILTTRWHCLHKTVRASVVQPVHLPEEEITVQTWQWQWSNSTHPCKIQKIK